MTSTKNDRIHLIGGSIDDTDSVCSKSTDSVRLKKKNSEKHGNHVRPKKLDTQVGFKKNDSSCTTLVISSSSSVHVGQPSAAAEDRQRTGRYLAVGLTLVMCFIALYHTVMRQIPVLAGLTAPAIIMIVYVLWIFYFAKRRKRQITAV